jgi:hypothetical protein
VIELDLDDLRSCFGVGVAGNFAGHLEQAGEAADFEDVVAPAGEAPKGIFPWYVPGDHSFLGVFPLSHDRNAKPAAAGGGSLQIEPEAGVICQIAYDADGLVERLTPNSLAAFNDCSLRREGANKISEKKNWGPNSKGIARAAFAVDDLEPGGATGSLRLACFLRRDGVAHAYGAVSALSDYSYYGGQLLDWIVDRLRNQTGSPDTPLEPVGEYLARAGNPPSMLIGIGATRYTPFGENTFLEVGDQSLVIVYDEHRHSQDEVETAVNESREADLAAASILRQTVYQS